jgi:hypothetical protein
MPADRHLLFGLLALQNGLINQGQLMLAFQAWTLDKSRSLADHLEARGDLTAAKRALLDALAEVHLQTHDGDVEKSLAAVPANRSTRASLAALGEPEIEATLARVARARNSRATECSVVRRARRHEPAERRQVVPRRPARRDVRVECPRLVPATRLRQGT